MPFECFSAILHLTTLKSELCKQKFQLFFCCEICSQKIAANPNQRTVTTVSTTGVACSLPNMAAILFSWTSLSSLFTLDSLQKLYSTFMEWLPGNCQSACASQVGGVETIIYLWHQSHWVAQSYWRRGGTMFLSSISLLASCMYYFCYLFMDYFFSTPLLSFLV